MRWTHALAMGIAAAACTPPATQPGDTLSIDASDTDDGGPTLPDVMDSGLVAPPLTLGAYTEFLNDERLVASFASAAARSIHVTIAVPESRVGEPALAEVLRAAQRAGVTVRLWPVLRRELGYYPNESNAVEFGAMLERLLTWVRAEGLRADAIVFDLEPGTIYGAELGMAWEMGVAAVERLMLTHIDAQQFAVSRARFTAMITQVHSAGLRAVCVTYPQVLDDLADGDDDIQDGLDIPVRAVPWDEIAVMAYQSSFAQAAQGTWLGPGLIRSYAESGRAAFGDRAVIALGIVGAFPGFISYASPATLAVDISAARGAGIARVEIYSLEGILGVEQPDAWWNAAQNAAPSRPAISPIDRAARGIAAMLDMGLNGASSDAGVPVTDARD